MDGHRLASKRTAIPKWRLFGGEAEERSFRVLAMTWWEAAVLDGQDDVLVAIIETIEVVTRRRQPVRYLACWSVRR